MPIKSLIIISLLLTSLNLYSQQRTFISPGIKLGYAFGNNGGFLFGVEISIVQHTKDKLIYGAVISFDHIKDAVIFHAGFEVGGFIGVELGPSLIINNGDKSFGFGITSYIGFILIPFANYSWFSNKQSVFQTGSFIKIPIQIDGRKYSLGG